MDHYNSMEQIIRYLAGECNQREKRDVEAWLDSKPEYKKAVENFGKVWDKKLYRTRQFDVEAAWNRVSRDIEQKRMTGLRSSMQRVKDPSKIRTAHGDLVSNCYRYVRVAAILVIATMIGLFAYYWIDDYHQDQLQVVETDRGERSSIQMSDGSNIRLNMDSRLSYHPMSDADRRVVFLEGEAYFEVAKDERPFYVLTEDLLIQVLGTEFNVQSYQNDRRAKVVVTAGEVTVSAESDEQQPQLSLKSGEMAKYHRFDNKKLEVERSVDLYHHLAWLDNRLHFEDTYLYEVISELERWFGVEIKLENEEQDLSMLRFTGEFQGESLLEIIGTMKYSLQLNKSVTNNTIKLSKIRELD